MTPKIQVQCTPQSPCHQGRPEPCAVTVTVTVPSATVVVAAASVKVTVTVVASGLMGTIVMPCSAEVGGVEGEEALGAGGGGGGAVVGVVSDVVGLGLGVEGCCDVGLLDVGLEVAETMGGKAVFGVDVVAGS